MGEDVEPSARWMNDTKGAKAIGLLGKLVKMDVDEYGKANGAFLRAMTAIEVNKSIHRGVLLRPSRNDEPKWFEAQYEKLTFFYLSCGVVVHSKLEFSSLTPRNKFGKLPY